MPRYIAFLRAINVGGHVVKMDALRRLFDALGCGNIETFIASGNVIFESPSKAPARLEKEIESHLKAALGYEVTTFRRSLEELRAAAAREPFGAGVPTLGHSLYVSFLKAAPQPAVLARVLSLQTEVDRLQFAGRELYWLRQGGQDDSTLSGAAIERALQGPATARNITTVRRMAAKYG